MSRAGVSGTAARSSPRRAHRSLWVLVAISILAAGVLSSAVSAPASPLTGMAFALSAVVLASAGMLAVRVIIALERARRATRPSRAPLATDFPVSGRLFNVLRKAGRSVHVR